MLIILSGPVHSGKTTMLLKIVDELKKIKVAFDGFLSYPIIKKEEITGYSLLDIKKNTFTPFITKSEKKNWQNIGPFFFIPEGLEKAEGIIHRGSESDLLIVDEVGPLEIKKQGLWPSLQKVLHQANKNMLLVIRENILEDFLVLVDERRVKLFNNRKKDIFPKIIRAIKENVVK